jgi:hypothetical protein
MLFTPLSFEPSDYKNTISTGYELYDRGVAVQVPVGSLLHIMQTGSGAHQPPIELVPGVMRRGREADY